MTAIVVAACCVVIAGIASHAFHSFLKLRARELLSDADKAALSKRLDELEKWKPNVVQHMANTRPR